MNDTERKQSLRQFFPTRKSIEESLKRILMEKIVLGSITTQCGIFTFLVGNYVMFAVEDSSKAVEVVKNIYDLYEYGHTVHGKDLPTVMDSPEVKKMISHIAEAVHPNEHKEPTTI